MLGGLLLVAGTPVRLLGRDRGDRRPRVGMAAIWIEPYRRARLLSFLDPWDDAQGAGFQSVQALIGLGSGGLFGKGLGQGVQKIFYLPEAHTDMIFAIVGEELGLIGVDARDRRLRRVRLRGAAGRARAAAIRSASASPPRSRRSSAARRRSTSPPCWASPR